MTRPKVRGPSATASIAGRSTRRAGEEARQRGGDDEDNVDDVKYHSQPLDIDARVARASSSNQGRALPAREPTPSHRAKAEPDSIALP